MYIRALWRWRVVSTLHQPFTNRSLVPEGSRSASKLSKYTHWDSSHAFGMTSMPGTFSHRDIKFRAAWNFFSRCVKYEFQGRMTPLIGNVAGEWYLKVINTNGNNENNLFIHILTQKPCKTHKSTLQNVHFTLQNVHSTLQNVHI